MYDYFKVTYKTIEKNAAYYLIKHPTGTLLKLEVKLTDKKIILSRLTESEYESELEKITSLQKNNNNGRRQIY